MFCVTILHSRNFRRRYPPGDLEALGKCTRKGGAGGGNLRQLEVLRPGGPAPPAALAELGGDVIQERVALPSGFWLMFSPIRGRIQ